MQALIVAACAFVLAVVFGKLIIPALRALHAGQSIREIGPSWHNSKAGTPTMGGLLILGTATAAILLFASLLNPMVWVCLAVMWIYGVVGFADDYVKVTKQTSNAMTAKMKLLLQFMTALVSVLVISYYTPAGSRYSLTIPYFKNLALNLWLFYVPFAMVVIAGASNAVNLSLFGFCVYGGFCFLCIGGLCLRNRCCAVFLCSRVAGDGRGCCGLCCGCRRVRRLFVV